MPGREGEKRELDAGGKRESEESEENGYYLLCLGWRSMGEPAGRAAGVHISFVLISRIYESVIELLIYFRVWV